MTDKGCAETKEDTKCITVKKEENQSDAFLKEILKRILQSSVYGIDPNPCKEGCDTHAK